MPTATRKDNDTSSFAAGVSNGAGTLIGGVTVAVGAAVGNHAKDLIADVLHNSPIIIGSTLAVGAGTALLNEYFVKKMKDKWDAPLYYRVVKVGNDVQFIHVDEYRLLRQMERAFLRSHLEDIEVIRNSRITVLENCNNVHADVREFTNDAEHVFAQVSSGSSFYDDNTLTLFKTALARSGPIYIKCMADQPGIIAALFHMKYNYKLPNIYIDYTEPSGFNHVNNIKGRVLAGRPFDYIFSSNADLLLGRSQESAPLRLQDEYRLVLPIYKTRGYVVRPVSAKHLAGMDGVEQIRYVPYGASDELRSRTIKLTGNTYDEVPIASNEAQLIDKKAPWNEATLLWEHSYIPLKSAGKAFSVTSMEYEYWISMFSYRRRANCQVMDIAFAGAFIQAWLYCKNRLRKSKSILRGVNLLPSFQSAMHSTYSH